MKTGSCKICFVGNMLGRNPGYVTSQGQILADLLQGEGYEIICVSSRVNKVRRLLDIVQTLVRRRKQIDLVVLEVYSGLSMVMADVASSLCKLLGLPLISVLHGGNLPVFAKKYRRWVRRVLGSSDILVAPSSFLAKELEFLGFEIKIIPNTLKIGEYPFRLRRDIGPKLIWMRSFHPIYNPYLAVKVFALLKMQKKEATLVMAGTDKGIEADVKEMVRKMGLQESVRFPGFLEMPDKIREFSDADIYLNTNKIDNMPVSVIEACAMGLPVVATNVGGLPHLISNRETGLLVSDDNAQEIADAVDDLLEDSELTERMSGNGRLLAEDSAWDKVRKKWEDLFADLLTQKRRRK